MAADLAIKEPCRVATTEDITLSGTPTIDGVTIAANDRVLVKAQSNAVQNGIYVAASGSWSRATDFDGAGEVAGGTLVVVTSGARFADSTWRVDGNGTVTINTDTIAFKLEGAGIQPTDYANGFAVAAATQIASILPNDGDAYSWTAYQESAIVIEPGVYGDVDPVGSNSNPCFFVRARVPGTVTLDRSGESDYFFERSNALLQSDVRGLNIQGGKGLLRHSHTGNNVQAYQVFEDLTLLGYTECAISSSSDNMPYWKLNRLVFRGTDTSIGFATNGYYDSSSILDCEFHNGKYGIKAVGNRATTLSVERSSFFTIRPEDDESVNESKEADIWLGASPAYDASGPGTVFRQNRFGNENLSDAEEELPDGTPRVIIAEEDEGSGANVATRSHSTSESDGFVDGLSFLDNSIFGNAGITVPFIRSYANKISRLRFEGNLTGAPHTYMIEYMGADAAEDTYLSATNYVRLMPGSERQRPFKTAVWNRCRGIAEDPFGHMQGDVTVQFAGVNDQTSYKKLAQGQGLDGAVAGVSQATVSGGFLDCRNASEVTAAGEGNYTTGWYVSLDTVTPNRSSRLELCLKAGSTASLDEVGVLIYNPVSGAYALDIPVQLDSEGARLSCFFVPPSDDPANWLLIVYAKGYVASTKTNFIVGDFHVYHGRSPINSTHIFTAGGGGWNQPHIVMGSKHIAVGSDGALRYKTSAFAGGAEGSPLGMKVGVPGSSSAAGKPGDWAADSTYIYTYTGNGSSHSWVRSSAATW